MTEEKERACEQKMSVMKESNTLIGLLKFQVWLCIEMGNYTIGVIEITRHRTILWLSDQQNIN